MVFVKNEGGDGYQFSFILNLVLESITQHIIEDQFFCSIQSKALNGFAELAKKRECVRLCRRAGCFSVVSTNQNDTVPGRVAFDS